MRIILFLCVWLGGWCVQAYSPPLEDQEYINTEKEVSIIEISTIDTDGSVIILYDLNQVYIEESKNLYFIDNLLISTNGSVYRLSYETLSSPAIIHMFCETPAKRLGGIILDFILCPDTAGPSDHHDTNNDGMVDAEETRRMMEEWERREREEMRREAGWPEPKRGVDPPTKEQMEYARSLA